MQKFKKLIFPALALCFALILGAFFAGRRSVDGVVLTTQRAAPAATEAVRALPAASEEKPEQPARIELNRATLEELITLPGIGEARAKHILDYRAANGPFRQASELMNVKGIGEGIYAGLRDLVYVEGYDENSDH